MKLVRVLTLCISILIFVTPARAGSAKHFTDQAEENALCLKDSNCFEKYKKSLSDIKSLFGTIKKQCKNEDECLLSGMYLTSTEILLLLEKKMGGYKNLSHYLTEIDETDIQLFEAAEAQIYSMAMEEGDTAVKYRKKLNQDNVSYVKQLAHLLSCTTQFQQNFGAVEKKNFDSLTNDDLKERVYEMTALSQKFQKLDENKFHNIIVELGIASSRGQSELQRRKQGDTAVADVPLKQVAEKEKDELDELLEELEAEETEGQKAETIKEQKYYKIRVGDSYGICDYKGNVVIEPIFEDISIPDEEGLIKFKRNRLYGYMTIQGNVVIKPMCESTYSFSNGLAQCENNEKYGFINTKGDMVIKPAFDAVWDFEDSSRYTKIEKRGSRYYECAIINKKGQMVTPYTRGTCDILDENHYFISKFSNDQWYGFLYNNGKILLEGFKSAQTVEDGNYQKKQAASIVNYKTHKVLYSLRTDKIISKKYDDIRSFISGTPLLAVKRNGKWGYINIKGKEVIKPQFDDAWMFSNDLASVRLNGKWGHINTKGELIGQPRFDERYEFGLSNKLASVKKNGKQGLVHADGRIIVKPEHKYTMAKGSTGFVETRRGASYTVDINGKKIADTGPSLWLITDGLICYGGDPRYGVGNIQGYAKTKLKLDDCPQFPDLNGNTLLAPADFSGKMALFNRKGEIVWDSRKYKAVGSAEVESALFKGYNQAQDKNYNAAYKTFQNAIALSKQVKSKKWAKSSMIGELKAMFETYTKTGHHDEFRAFCTSLIGHYTKEKNTDMLGFLHANIGASIAVQEGAPSRLFAEAYQHLEYACDKYNSTEGCKAKEMIRGWFNRQGAWGAVKPITTLVVNGSGRGILSTPVVKSLKVYTKGGESYVNDNTVTVHASSATQLTFNAILQFDNVIKNHRFTMHIPKNDIGKYLRLNVDFDSGRATLY